MPVSWFDDLENEELDLLDASCFESWEFSDLPGNAAKSHEISGFVNVCLRGCLMDPEHLQ